MSRLTTGILHTIIQTFWGATCERTMEKDLTETLRITHDWVVDRLHYLCQNYDINDSNSDIVHAVEDAYSVQCEFAEWLDPDATECEIYSLPQLTND